MKCNARHKKKMSKLSFTHLKFCLLFNLKFTFILKLIHFYFELVPDIILNLNLKINFIFNLNVGNLIFKN